MFMPPAADEQAAMQQKMMQYMTLFMGIMFFKVASGLCVYFIASSIWGIAERKLLPKTLGKSAPPAGGVLLTAATPAAGNGSPANGKKRQRGRK
jgi:YidC/Oxa1 family membrane protein insertase